MTFYQRKCRKQQRDYRLPEPKLKRWHVVIAALLIIVATVLASYYLFSPWGTHHGSTVLREVR